MGLDLFINRSTPRFKSVLRQTRSTKKFRMWLYRAWSSGELVVCNGLFGHGTLIGIIRCSKDLLWSDWHFIQIRISQTWCASILDGFSWTCILCRFAGRHVSWRISTHLVLVHQVKLRLIRLTRHLASFVVVLLVWKSLLYLILIWASVELWNIAKVASLIRSCQLSHCALVQVLIAWVDWFWNGFLLLTVHHWAALQALRVSRLLPDYWVCIRVTAVLLLVLNILQIR